MKMCKIYLAFVVIIIGSVTTCCAEQRSRRPSTVFKKKSFGLILPNNATSIRENIVDIFSCDNRRYGYYADIDNECQIFHVCLPSIRNSIRFSFICPAETVFNQATFVCTQTESSIPCEESEKYYVLNDMFGKENENTEESITESKSNEIEPTTWFNSRLPSIQQSTSFYPQRPPSLTTNYQTVYYTQKPPKSTQST